MVKSEITYRRITEIHPYIRNPRKNDKAVKAVVNSIKEFGFKNPIIVNAANNEIICGHTRYKAAKELSIQEIPCVMVDDLTEEQVKAFRIADNSTSGIAEWDFDLLAIEISEIKTIGMTDFGLTFQPPQNNVKDDDYIIPETINTRAKLGDIWLLGRHRLVCGDSTKAETLRVATGGGAWWTV